jgi:uncharacterized protein (DUF58 family)
MALLSRELLAKLTRFSLKSRSRKAGIRAGAHRSRRRGQSQEFADHRAYVPGDDIRYLDWHLYGRLDTLWIKLFEAEDDRVIQLFLDNSASMNGAKLDLAKKLAGALSVIALASQDRLAFAAVNDTLHSYAPPSRGRQRVAPTLKTLEGLPCEGGTRWQEAMAGAPRHRGSGVALLFTDGLDEGGLEASLRRLSARNDEVHLFHILSPEDWRPSLRGDLLLIDSETGAELPVSIDERYIDEHEATVAEWAQGLRRQCQRLGVGYSLLSTADDIDDILFRDLRRQQVLSR